MTRAGSWLGRATLSCLSLAALACEEVVPTTQILVVVDADEVLAAETHTVLLATSRGSQKIQRGQAPIPFPFTFSLVPLEEDFEGIVHIEARDAQGAILVDRQLELGFRSRRTLSYGVLLAERCAVHACTDEETCDGCLGCVPTRVEDEELVPLRRASDAISTWRDALRCEPTSDAGMER